MDNYFGEQVLTELFGFGKKSKQIMEPAKAIEKAQQILKQWLSSLKNNESVPRWDELMIVKYLDPLKINKEKYENFINNSGKQKYCPFAEIKARSGLLGKAKYRGKYNSDYIIDQDDLDSIDEDFFQSFYSECEFKTMKELSKNGYTIEIDYAEDGSLKSWLYISK